MTRRMQDRAVQFSEFEALSIGEELVPLRSVAGKNVRKIVDIHPDFLHLGDLLADGGLAAQLPFQVRGGGEVVGMGMGVQNPFDFEAGVFDVSRDVIGAVGAGAGGFLVKVPDGIYDCGALAGGVRDDILDTAGFLIVECFYERDFCCHAFLGPFAAKAKNAMRPAARSVTKSPSSQH